jgi:hypothetical protein
VQQSTGRYIAQVRSAAVLQQRLPACNRASALHKQIRLRNTGFNPPKRQSRLAQAQHSQFSGTTCSRHNNSLTSVYTEKSVALQANMPIWVLVGLQISLFKKLTPLRSSAPAYRGCCVGLSQRFGRLCSCCVVYKRRETCGSRIRVPSCLRSRNLGPLF